MRALRLLAVFALVCAAALTGAGQAAALDPGRGTAGYCPSASGVTVIVDFQDLGGDVIIRCAPGEQASGLTALQNAGLSLTGVQRWGLGFICRIESKPSARSEACVDTPPASAYWGYWHAPNGGGWTYSQYGVMNRKPPQGTFEGWSFSHNRSSSTNPAPRIAASRPGQPVGRAPSGAEQNGAIPGRDGMPQAAPVNPPAAAPTTKAPASSAPAPKSSAPASAGSSSSAASTPPPPPQPSVGGVAPGGIAWTGGTGLPVEQPEGFPWGAVTGGAAVLLLAGAGGFLAWRRRRARLDGGGFG